MRPLLFLFLVAVVLGACQQRHQAPTNPAQLTDSSIYNIDSVEAVMASGSENAARKQLLTAVNIYKNVRDASASIPLFKQAIRLKPSAGAYFELGCALLDDGRYQESAEALHIAEKLSYTPLANVMARLAAAYSHLHDPDGLYNIRYDSLALHYMEVALQMGYARPEEFRTNDLFAKLKEDYGFIKRYNNALGGGDSKDPGQMLWESYTSEFETARLPIVINIAWMKDHPLDNSISYDYEKFVPEMRTAKFSREVDKQYYYFALVKKDTAWSAFLYAGKTVALASETMPPPEFFLLVTYDAAGKIIDKMQVAGQQSFTDAYKVFTMQPNYSFEVRDFKNVYKDDPQQAGYDSNAIVRTDPLGVANYRIAANGKFEKTDAPLAMR